jgi:TonB family protein
MIWCLGCGDRPASAPDIVPATLSSEPAIPFPPELFAKRIEGEVLLYLVVDSTGTALRDSTRVARSSGQAAFDAAALEAAGALHFAPATRAGVPVTAPIQVPIRFSLPDSIKNARDHQ